MTYLPASQHYQDKQAKRTRLKAIDAIEDLYRKRCITAGEAVEELVNLGLLGKRGAWLLIGTLERERLAEKQYSPHKRVTRRKAADAAAAKGAA